MMRYIYIITLLISFEGFSQKKLDFGLEVQMNNNLVDKWLYDDVYDDNNLSFSILDQSNDTLNIYLNKFSMENNFEVPIYFRYNWKNRQFLDFKLSNSFNTLTMEGVSNYNDSYYIENYGSYDDFAAQAMLDGFTDIDTADYTNYITASKSDWESRIKSTEKFQLLSLTMNYGLRFFPHKSVKAFVAAGYTIKGKYRKVNYQHLDFSNDYVKDLSAIEPGINKFAETSLYFNLIMGLELYKFRLSLFYQTGSALQFTNAALTDKIVYINPFTPFDRIHSYGFSMGVDLFSKNIGDKVSVDDLSVDDKAISKMRRKKDKWDLGVRFNRRGFNELSTFYSNPSNQLSIMTRDSVLINDNGTIRSADNIELLTFGDIKRIGWTGQIDLFGNYYLSKRFSVEGLIGFSILRFDVATNELKATVVHDTAGVYYLDNPGTPKLRSAAFRQALLLTNITGSIAYKIVDRDLFDFKVMAGIGITSRAHLFQGNVNHPNGINELDIYDEAESVYFNFYNQEIYSHQGEMNIDLNESPDEVLSKFPSQDYIKETFMAPKRMRQIYPTVKIGVEANIDRYTVGMSMERSLNYMDGFLLNQYGTVYFSIGYKLWAR